MKLKFSPDGAVHFLPESTKMRNQKSVWPSEPYLTADG
jgi:hypothetical protein